MPSGNGCGKWVVSNNLRQSLGVVAMAMGLANLPFWFVGRGTNAVPAGRYATGRQQRSPVPRRSTDGSRLPARFPDPGAGQGQLWASIVLARRLGVDQPAARRSPTAAPSSAAVTSWSSDRTSRFGLPRRDRIRHDAGAAWHAAACRSASRRRPRWSGLSSWA